MKNTSEDADEKTRGMRKETAARHAGVDSAAANLTGETKWIAVVEEKVRNLRFGIIQITIHNGKVVQIDSTEKTRVEI